MNICKICGTEWIDNAGTCCKRKIERAEAERDAAQQDRRLAIIGMESNGRERDAAIKALEDANSLCRSAYQVAQRFGEETSWREFTDSLRESLKRQHKILHPTAIAASKEKP